MFGLSDGNPRIEFRAPQAVADRLREEAEEAGGLAALAEALVAFAEATADRPGTLPERLRAAAEAASVDLAAVRREAHQQGLREGQERRIASLAAQEQHLARRERELAARERELEADRRAIAAEVEAAYQRGRADERAEQQRREREEAEESEARFEAAWWDSMAQRLRDANRLTLRRVVWEAEEENHRRALAALERRFQLLGFTLRLVEGDSTLGTVPVLPPWAAAMTGARLLYASLPEHGDVALRFANGASVRLSSYIPILLIAAGMPEKKADTFYPRLNALPIRGEVGQPAPALPQPARRQLPARARAFVRYK